MEPLREANLIVGDNVVLNGVRYRVAAIPDKGPSFVDGEFLVQLDPVPPGSTDGYVWTSELT